MRLLQVCNVGRIVGGTAACAWTVTRALPALEHHVAFLSPPDAETIRAFAPTPVSTHGVLTDADLARLRPDAILLHNTPRSRWNVRSHVPTVLSLHSEIADPVAADVAICCSQWLARLLGMPADRVLWQAVGKSAPLGRPRVAANQLVVGRLCTPTMKKWPRNIVPFYATLARRFPHVCWEFVGCPRPLQCELQSACGNRATFYTAGWSRRSRLAAWDALLYSNPSLPESFGRVVAEAMRAGCVPVVDRLGGFIEQIPPGCGFLCDGVDEFAAALGQLTNPEFQQEMSHQAERHADDCFSLARFARELLRWFDVAAGCLLESRL